MATVRRAFALIGTTFAVAALAFAWLPGQAAAGQPEEPGAQARALLDLEGAIPSAAELPELIRPDHPRLFMNEEMWPGMRARALGEANAEYREMQEIAQGLPPLEEIGTQDWGRQLARSAFVYRMTGNELLLAKIQRMLERSMDFYDRTLAAQPEGASTWNGPVRQAHLDYPFTRISWLAALDWVWNDLAPEKRQELSSRMIRHVHAFMARFLSYSWTTSFYKYDNMVWYAGLTLFSDELPPGDHELALEILQRGYDDHRKMFNLRARAAGDDGDFQYVHVEYVFPASPHAEWSFYHSWRSGILEPIPEPWLSKSALYPNLVFWTLVPGLRHFGVASAWHRDNYPEGGSKDLTKRYVGNYLAQHIHFCKDSHPEMAELSRWLWARMDFQRQGKYGFVPLGSAIWSPVQEGVSAELPESLLLARHFESSGQIFMRSGNGPADTYALFLAGGDKEFDSDQFDNTHFGIYKRGFLALDTGTRNAMPHQTEYYSQTVAHNCVLIRMPGEAFYGMFGKGQPAQSNAAGQGGQESTPAQTLAFESHPLFAYAASDASATYHPDKCAQMVRQFLFLRPDHFVVFDRVRSTKAEYPKTWLLHTANEPVVAGKAFHADQAQGRLFCRTHYPLDAQLVKVGGPGKEFWSDGRNWPVYTGRALNQEVPELMGRWRVEVKPGAAREQDVFLHLIQVSDQSVEQMVDSDVSEDEDQIELNFTVGARTYMIALNKTGEVGGHIRVEEEGEMLVDRPLTQEIMPQAGLALVE